MCYVRPPLLHSLRTQFVCTFPPAGSYTNDLVGDGGGGLFIDNSGGSVGNGTVILENITAADNNGAGSRAKAIGPG